MRTFARYMDGPTVAAEVRLERQKHKGAFLLVEGATDIRRFERFIDEETCSFVNCFGKGNAIEAIELLYEEGFLGALGAVDADFDRVLGVPRDHEGIIVSDTHDFDLDAISTTVLERYTNEVADLDKLASIGGARPLFRLVIESLKPLTMLRYANERHALGYKLGDLNIERFYDSSGAYLERMIDEVSWGKFNSIEFRSALRSHVERYMASGIDLMQATSGHDFCQALGLWLRQRIGCRRNAQTWRSEVELHVRLAFDIGHFAETNACRAVIDWQAHNRPYQILRQIR